MTLSQLQLYIAEGFAVLGAFSGLCTALAHMLPASWRGTYYLARAGVDIGNVVAKHNAANTSLGQDTGQ